MKAAEAKLENLLEGGKHYQIPLFQRPYSWRKPNWQVLWDDLVSLHPNDLQHYQFLGPIVTLSADAEPEGVSSFLVIDGQQRLTTLTVLLAALRDHIRATAPSMLTLADEIHETYLVNKYKDGDAKLKVLPSQEDRESYRKVILNPADKVDGPVRQAYDFFLDRLAEPDPDDEIPIDARIMKTIVLGRTTLISIRLDSEDNPYLIFESLNYKGEPLTQADLVRNYVFMRLPSATREDTFITKWRPMQDEFRAAAGDDAYLDELTFAFWYYLRKDGEPVRADAVYPSVKARMESELGKLQELLDDLVTHAQLYRRIRFPDVEPEPRLARWFLRFRRLDYTTSYPFLLTVYAAYRADEISLEDFEHTLQRVESYFVRRLLVGVPTNSLAKVFNVLSSQIDRADWLGSLTTALHRLTGNLRWPDDEETLSGILSRPIYGTRQDRLKLLLETIDDSLNKEHVNHSQLQIEHIMPQELTVTWNEDLGSEAEAIHSGLLHTLGNLTLTGYNPEMSNKPFSEKLQWLRGSPVPLNRHFDNIEYWRGAEIEARATTLANSAVTIWPR